MHPRRHLSAAHLFPAVNLYSANRTDANPAPFPSLFRLPPAKGCLFLTPFFTARAVTGRDYFHRRFVALSFARDASCVDSMDRDNACERLGVDTICFVKAVEFFIVLRSYSGEISYIFFSLVC